MNSRRALFLSCLLAIFAGPGVAQEGAHFAGGSGGELQLVPKGSNRFSGSLGLSFGSQGSGFDGFDVTLGGSLLKDRVWFFGALQQQDARLFTPVAEQAQIGTLRAGEMKLSAQLGSRQNLQALYSRSDMSNSAAPLSFPSSLLSLRYDAAVSNSLFFSATVSQRSSSHPLFPSLPAQQ